MSKRSAEDILKDLEDSDVEDAAERVLAMSPEERRRELLAAGFTEQDLRAGAAQWHERLRGAAPEPPGDRLAAQAREQVPEVTSKGGGLLLLVAAMAVAALVIAVLVFPRRASREAPMAMPSASAPAPTAPGASAAPEPVPVPEAGPPPPLKPTRAP